MQTNALKRLIAAVENGRWWADGGICAEAVNRAGFKRPNAKAMTAAFHGSLNAAKALHDALLPGWNWTIRETIEGWDAMVEKPIKIATVFSVSFDHAARAWLLAILRAKLAEAEAHP